MRVLDAATIDAVLERAGYGFLGFARGDRPYVIPVSFGYDGEALYFQLNDEGRKHEYITEGVPVTFNTVSPREGGTMESVFVEGTFHEVAGEDSVHAMEVLAENASFGTDFGAWNKPLQETDFSEYVLQPAELSGRSFG